MRTKLVTILGPLAMLTVLSDAGASAADANSALGFESAGDWTIQNGTILGTSSQKTQGLAALAVHASGYTVLRSRSMGPLGQVSKTVSFDLGLPSPMQPYWSGATQLFVSVPSRGLNNAYIGQVELTGLIAGAYNRIKFTIPDDLLPKLRETYSDLSFAIVLNVPATASDKYLLDNFEVSSTIPPNSTVGLQDRAAILGFERAVWTISSGTVVGLTSSKRTQGNFGLAIQPHGYSTLTSPPLPSIGPVDTEFSFVLSQPSISPAPGSYGAAQLFVSIPSQGVYSEYLGQVDLNGIQRDGAWRLKYSVPSWLVPKLNEQYTDLTFSIALNVPWNATGTYYLDDFDVGVVTRPIKGLPSGTPPIRDLVGKASSGIAALSVDGISATVNVVDAEFFVEEPNKTCVVTATQACRYVVQRIKLTTGPVTIPGGSITSTLIENVGPFEVVLGGAGASSLTSAIPGNAPFRATSTMADGSQNSIVLNPGSNASITISAAGSGMIAVATQFQGVVDGHSLSLDGVVTATSPLANRPPVASAGPDRTVTSSKCFAFVSVDGSASTDPDNNIRSVLWYDAGVLVGSGLTPTLSIHYPGVHVLTIVVTDDQYSVSTDQMSVTANIAKCTTEDPPPSDPVLL